MRKRKTSVATKIIGILIGLGVITGLMCFLNLMAYDVLEGYNLSLQKTVVDLENATEADATALAEEANYLLERIDVKIRGTYVFDIVLIVISFIVTIVAIVISLRMIAKPLKQVSQTLNEITTSIENNQGDLTVRVDVKSNDEVGQMLFNRLLVSVMMRIEVLML